MKHLILYLLLLASFAGYSQHPVKRSKLKGGFIGGGPAGIVEWNPATVTEPVYADMEDGDYFWLNPQGVGLRNAFHWFPTQYSLPTVGSNKRFQFSVNPRVPDGTGEGHWNNRAEVTQNGNQVCRWVLAIALDGAQSFR